MQLAVINDVTTHFLETEQSRRHARIFFAVSLLLIGGLALFSWLLSESLRKLKAQSEKINDFNHLRQTFIDADNSIVWLKDPDLKYVFVNKAAAAFHDKSVAEMIGRSDAELVGAEIAQRREQTDRQVLTGRVAVTKEFTAGDNTMRVKKFPVELARGEFGVGAYIKDITAEYNSNRIMHKNLQRNEILVQVMERDYAGTQEQLEHVLEEALKLTESEYGYIYVYDDQNEEFILNSWSKKVQKHCTILRPQTRQKLSTTGLWGEVVRQRKHIIWNDLSHSQPGAKGHPPGHIPVKRFMSVPIIIDGRITAVIGLANKSEEYDHNDVYQISVLMHGVWHSVERRARMLELEEANQALKENEARLQLLLDSTYEGIYGLDLAGNCTMCNASCLRMLGYDHQDELIGKKIHELIHHHQKDGTEVSADECRIYTAIKRGEGISVDNEVLWRKDGTCFDAEYFSFPQIVDGKVVGAVVTFLDITKRKQSEAEIYHLSYRDALTGLHNRRFFEKELRRLDSEDDLPLSVIIGDVNGLKLANDIFGHTAGDLLLQRIGQILKDSCRACDVVVRWGGDEYALILPQTDAASAKKVVSRIQEVVASERARGLIGSISLGTATKSSIEQPIWHVVQQAEERMYAIKTLQSSSIDNHLLEEAIGRFYAGNASEARHGSRVSELCVRIGQALKLDQSALGKLEVAGNFHDIGKMGVDHRILLKAGPLTSDERQSIERHPLTGYRILHMWKKTVDLAEHVLQHHERWDGKGYPQGLQGAAISQIARIIAVAESFDAMTTDSSYRKALNHAEALQEIQNNAGTQFDPVVARVLVDLIGSQGNSPC